MTYSIGVLLYEDFEILDVYGPVEMFGMHRDKFNIRMVAEKKGPVRSASGPQSIADDSIADGKNYDIVLVPGGPGTWSEIDNHVLLHWITRQVSTAKYFTTVCTGTALLAKTGALDGRCATTNKMNFDWVASHGPNVNWVYEARWIEDGNFFTSSGVSAGMDMSLALIRHLFDQKTAGEAAMWAEYSWHKDSTKDPFADVWRGKQPA